MREPRETPAVCRGPLALSKRSVRQRGLLTNSLTSSHQFLPFPIALVPPLGAHRFAFLGPQGLTGVNW